MNRPFPDRREAGRVLAQDLRQFAGRPDVVVLALPRGGIPVAFEVARALSAPLDVFVVRKLGAPGQEELAMGAIASRGVVVINDEVVRALDVSQEELETEITRQRVEVERRERLYRGDRPPQKIVGKTVIVIDDGLATGSTMRAAISALRRGRPARIVVAVPTSSRSVCEEFRTVADGCICSITPEPFRAVGLWYDDFAQVSDEEACGLLSQAGESAPDPHPPLADCILIDDTRRDSIQSLP